MSKPISLEVGKRYKFHIKDRLVGFSEYNDKILKVRLWNNDSHNFVLDHLVMGTIEKLELSSDKLWLFVLVRDVDYL